MSNKPPIEVPQGAIRLNTDSQKLEFFAQDRWYEMATDSPTFDGGSTHGGGARGVFAGGGDPADPTLDVMDFITISTSGNAADFGDLSSNRRHCHGVGSRTRNFVMGGYSDSAGQVRNTVEASVFASGGGSSSFCNLTASRYVAAAGGNSTRGLYGCGNSPNAPTIVASVDVFDLHSGTNAVDFGDMSLARQDTAGSANIVRFVVAGGSNSGHRNTIDFVTISTLGDGKDFGDLTSTSTHNGGASSPTRGIFCGVSPSTVTNCDKIEYATLGDAIDFGDMTVSRNVHAGVSDCVRIAIAGGNVPSGRTNVIDYTSFSTGGSFANFGDLTDVRGQLSGGSNGHGGL